MNLELTDEQRELRDTVRRFATERIDGADAWPGLVELGATGVLIDEEFGGAGLTMSDAVLVAEQLGAALLPTPWASSAVLAPRAIMRFEAEATSARLLTGIAHGTVKAAVAVGDVSAERGSLRGELAPVSDADADVLLVATEDALYLLEAGTPGLALVPLTGIDQLRRDFRVILDDAPAQTLATAGPQAVRALGDDALVIAAADALGAAQRLLDMVVDHAKTRVQFGSPIGSFQSVAHLCVDMHETVELMRSGLIHAAWAADAADSDERHLAALRLKAFSARLAEVGDTAVQIFGGIGFTWEHDAHRHLRRLLAFSALDGGSAASLEQVGALFVRSLGGQA